MGKPYNPADYNLVANPSLPETNSPWRPLVLLIGCALVIAVSWEFFTPDIRLTRPILAFSSGQVTATTEATNRTAKPVTLDIRIRVGAKGTDSEYGSGQFLSSAQQDVSVTVPPHSTMPVVCTFASPGGMVLTHAEAQLLTSSHERRSPITENEHR